MEKNCICLICHKPNKIHLDFLNTITEYDVVVIIDDENEHYYENNQEYYDTNYKKLIISQINHIECIENGYQFSSFTLNKMVSGWDKAIYFYYCLYNDKLKLKKQYNHVWFIEDDVFLYNEEILKNIDAKYPNSDFIAKDIHKKEINDWLWKYIIILIEEPYYKSLVCACRMSKKILYHIFEYVKQNKQLFFIEAMFPTIAMKNNLICDFPEELNTIEYRKNWIYNEVNKTNMFHPIKNIEFHKLLREHL